MKKTLKRLVCALLCAAVLTGELPAHQLMAAGADADQIIEPVGEEYTTTDETFPKKGVTLLPAGLSEDLQALKDDGTGVEDSYFVTGTSQETVEESGKYAITIYRLGNTEKESTVAIKSIDYSATYGKDYEIADDRYETEVFGMDKTLLEQTSDPENLAAAEEEMDEILAEGQTDNVISDAEMADIIDNDDGKTPYLATSSSGPVTYELIDTSGETEAVSETDPVEALNASYPLGESADPSLSLAELKQAETGKPTRETAEQEEEPAEDAATMILEQFIAENGVINVGDYLDYAAVTKIPFAPGETEKQLIFEVLEDKDSEGDEIIQFSLVEEAEGDYVIEPNISTIVILDDEPVERSQISLSDKSYTANRSGTKIRVVREGAPYNLVKATLLISNKTIEEEKIVRDIILLPYQMEEEVELTFDAESEAMDFDLSLMQIQGGDPGSIILATIHLPGTAKDEYDEAETLPDALAKAEDETLESVGNVAASDGDSIKIDGHVFTLKATDTKGVYDIMSGANDKVLNRKKPAKVGVYYAAASDVFRYKNCYHGEGTDPVHYWDKNNECFVLEYYSSVAWDYASTSQRFYMPMREYSGILLDYTATSSYTGAETLFAIEPGTFAFTKKPTFGMTKQLKVAGYQNYDGNSETEIENREFMGPIRMTQSSPYGSAPGRNSDARNRQDPGAVPYMGGQEMEFYVRTQRVNFGCYRPTVHVYGVACMYKSVKFELEDPDKLTYKKADGTTVSEYPARVNLQDNHKRFVNEPMTVAIEQNDNDIRVPKGRLKGWKIKPNGGTEFYVSREEAATAKVDWLSKDGMTFTVTDQFLDTLSLKGIKVEKADLTSEGYDMRVSIKPVFEYIDVHVRVLPSVGKGTFKSDAIKEQKEYIYHVGDEIDLSGTPESGWYYSGYSMAVYKNYDDTQAKKDGEVILTPLNYKLGNEERYDICPVFRENANVIEIRLDDEAKKYFNVQGLCSDSELTENNLKGKNILKIEKGRSQNDPVYSPVVGDAYEIRLENTPANADGGYRPKFTIESTGQVINGYVADIVAGAEPRKNIINVTAEKINKNDYEYFGIQSKAVYSGAKIRFANGEKTEEPAVDVSVYAGGIPVQGYDRNHEPSQIFIRNQVVTDTDGNFELPGFLAMPGDTVSVRFDNGDRQQVKYVKLPGNCNYLKSSERNISVLEADDQKKENKLVEKTNVKIYLVQEEKLGMPVISPRSPEIVKLSYEYFQTAMKDTTKNVVDLIADEDISFTAEVLDKGAPVSGVKFYLYDRNGNCKEEYTKNGNRQSNGRDYTVSYKVNKEIVAGDILYVQIESSKYDEVTHYNNDGVQVTDKIYWTYPKLNSGLVFGNMVEDADPQTISITPPSEDAMAKLPMIGNLGSGCMANSGSLTFDVKYVDENHKDTSPYCLVIGAGYSLKKHNERAKAYDKYKNGEDIEEQKSAKTKAEERFNENPEAAYTDAENTSVQNILNDQTMSQGQKMREKEKIDAQAKQRLMKNVKKEMAPDSIAALNKKYKGSDDPDASFSKKYPNFDFKLMVRLQLDFFLDRDANQFFFGGGQYMFGIAIGYNRVWHILAGGVIPVCLAFDLEVYASIDGRWVTQKATQNYSTFAKTKDLDAYLHPDDPWLTVGVNTKFSAGVGVYGVLSARGMLDLKGAFKWCFGDTYKPGSDKGLFISFGGGIALDVLFVNVAINTPKATYRSGVYETNKKLEKTGDGPDASVGLAAYDLSGEEISYLGTAGAGDDVLENTGLGIKAPDNIEKQMILVDKAAEYVRPGIVDGGNGKRFMTYLTKKNGTTRIAYAVDNGNGFSKEVLVDPKGSGTDTTNDLLYHDGKVYIAWTNAKKQAPAKTSGDIDEEVSVEDAKDTLQSMNLKLAVYDFATGSMSEPIDVTADKFINGHVRLNAEKDRIVLYYYKKDVDNVKTAYQLVSERSNYTTWMRAEYDTKTGKMVNLGTDAEPKTEAFVVIANDPLVLDYNSAVYTAPNGRDWRMTLYTVDRDLNSKSDDQEEDETDSVDAEIWLSVKDLDKGNETSAKIAEGDVGNARLNILPDDVMITWLENDDVFYSINARDLFYEDEKGVTDFEHIINNDDLVVTIDGTTTTSKYLLPTDAVSFAEGADNDASLSQYQVVSGKDGNVYLFTLAPGKDIDNFGQEIWGSSYYSNRERNEDGTLINASGRTGWGQLVQITEYNQVIDEMNLAVDEKHNVTILANMYENEVNEKKGLVQKNFKLVELDCEPVTSLEFSEDPEFIEEEEYYTVSEAEEEDTGFISNPYPLAGENTTIGFTLVNNGLLPANSYKIELLQEQNGKKTAAAEPIVVTPESTSVFADEEKDFDFDVSTIESPFIFTGEERDFTFDVTTPESLENLSYTVAVTEFDPADPSVTYGTVESKVDLEVKPELEKCSVSAVSGDAMLDTREYLKEKYNSYKNAGFNDKDAADAILSTLDEELAKNVIALVNLTQSADLAELLAKITAGEVYIDIDRWYSIVDFLNDGNAPAKNIKATVTQVFDDGTRGEVLGEGQTSCIEAREMGVIVSPIDVKDGTVFDRLGIMNIDVDVTVDGEDLGYEISQIVYTTENAGLTCDNAQDMINLSLGESKKLNIQAHPFNDRADIKYYSGDNQVVAIDGFGNITAVGVGIADVFAYDDSCDRRDAVKVFEVSVHNTVILTDNKLTMDSIDSAENDETALYLLKGGKYTFEEGMEITSSVKGAVSANAKNGKLTVKKDTVLTLKKGDVTKTVTVKAVSIKKKPVTLGSRDTVFSLAEVFTGAGELIPDSSDGKYLFGIADDKKGILKPLYTPTPGEEYASLENFTFGTTGAAGSTTVYAVFGGKTYKATVKCTGYPVLENPSNNLVRTLKDNVLTYDSVNDNDTLLLLKNGKYTLEPGVELSMGNGYNNAIKVNVNKKTGVRNLALKKEAIVTLTKDGESKTIAVNLVTIKKRSKVLKAKGESVTLADLYEGAFELLPDSLEGSEYNGYNISFTDKKGALLIRKNNFPATVSGDYATLSDFAILHSGNKGSATVQVTIGGVVQKATVTCK